MYIHSAHIRQHLARMKSHKAGAVVIDNAVLLCGRQGAQFASTRHGNVYGRSVVTL
jgi:nitrous oxidase accessory protein NosD